MNQAKEFKKLADELEEAMDLPPRIIRKETADINADGMERYSNTSVDKLSVSKWQKGGEGKFTIDIGPYVLASGESSWSNQEGYDDLVIDQVRVVQLESFLEELQKGKLEPGTYRMDPRSREKEVSEKFGPAFFKMKEDLNKAVKEWLQKHPKDMKTFKEEHGWSDRNIQEMLKEDEWDLNADHLAWNLSENQAFVEPYKKIISPLYDDVERRKNEALREIKQIAGLDPDKVPKRIQKIIDQYEKEGWPPSLSKSKRYVTLADRKAFKRMFRFVFQDERDLYDRVLYPKLSKEGKEFFDKWEHRWYGMET